MISEEQKTIVREKFIMASKEFGFNFISPYCLDEKQNLYIFGYIYREKKEKGVRFDLSCFKNRENEEAKNWCQERGLFFSVLHVEPLLREYKSSYFEDLLDDWKYDMG